MKSVIYIDFRFLHLYSGIKILRLLKCCVNNLLKIYNDDLCCICIINGDAASDCMHPLGNVIMQCSQRKLDATCLSNQ